VPARPLPAAGRACGARRLVLAAALAAWATALLPAGQGQRALAQAAVPPPAATGGGTAAPGTGTAAPGDSPADRDASAAAAPLLHHREELLVEGAAELVPATTTILKLPLPTRLVPATIDVIGAPLLEQQDAHVLGDALRDASGVASTPSPAPPTSSCCAASTRRPARW